MEWFCDEYGLDYNKWKKKPENVKDNDDYIDFEIDFWKAWVTASNEIYIKRIEKKELTGKDRRDAESFFESWYSEKEENYEDALLFDEDDVDAYYLVTGEICYEEDGEKDSERFRMLVVDTSEGCFIIYTDREPNVEHSFVIHF